MINNLLYIFFQDSFSATYDKIIRALQTIDIQNISALNDALKIKLIFAQKITNIWLQCTFSITFPSCQTVTVKHWKHKILQIS